MEHCFHCFPVYLTLSDGTGGHDLSFLNVEFFKPAFSLFSFTFIKRLFSSSSLSAIRVVSSTCLRLLIFLLAILIPAYASFSPAFLMMYSAYRTSLVAQIVKCLSTMRETRGLSPGLGRSPEEGNGNPLQYFCVENPMDGRAWQATVHGVAKSHD